MIKLGLTILRELAVLGSKKSNSLLRDKLKTSLLSFSWKSMWMELEVTIPTLLRLLEATLNFKAVSDTANYMHGCCYLIQVHEPHNSIIHFSFTGHFFISPRTQQSVVCTRWLPHCHRGSCGNRGDSEDWNRWRRHREWSGAPRLGPPYGGPTLPFGKTLHLR